MNRLSSLLLFACLAAISRAETPLESAVALYHAKNYPAASDAFAKIAAADPQNAAAHFYLGALAKKRGDNDEAVRQLEQATQLAPANSNYFLELGGAYGAAAQKAGLLAKLGWARKCGEALEKSVALDPENLAARNGLVSFYREAPSFVGGGTEKAHQQAEEIRKRDPLMGAAILGQLYLGENKIDDAFTVYEAALKTNPDNYSILYAIGRAAAQTNQHLDRGEQALKRCLGLTPAKGDPGPAAVQWRLGNIAEKRGDLTSARAAYQAALKLDPNFKSAADALAKLPAASAK